MDLSTIFKLPNDTYVDFSLPESKDIAKAAHINAILKNKANKKVYPIIGSTFSDVKKKPCFWIRFSWRDECNFELSISDLVKNYVRDTRSSKFKIPFDKAVKDMRKMRQPTLLPYFMKNLSKRMERIN